MNILALDIGDKRTGLALCDTEIGVPVSLETIHAPSEELVHRIPPIIKGREVDILVVGVPYLLSGNEGSQSRKTREIAEKVAEKCQIELEFLDERFTSTSLPKGIDTDAAAACEILSTYLSIFARKDIDKD